MLLFDEATVSPLRDAVLGKAIDSVSLASYGFEVRFDEISVFGSERVFAQISGLTYEWGDKERSGPWGLLVGQPVTAVVISSPDRLKIELVAGDYLEFETVVGSYESLIVNFPKEDGKIVMEIF